MPHLAITVASALTIACLFALLFYVHKIARSIIADNVVDAITAGLQRDLREILPEEAPRQRAPAVMLPRSGSVSLGRRGYIQVVNYEALVGIACREKAVLEVAVRAGHHVLQRGDHVVVRSRNAASDRTKEDIRDAFTIGNERTPAQDPEHGMRQLVPSVPMMLRQRPAGSLPLRAEVTASNGYAPFE